MPGVSCHAASVAREGRQLASLAPIRPRRIQTNSVAVVALPLMRRQGRERLGEETAYTDRSDCTPLLQSTRGANSGRHRRFHVADCSPGSPMPCTREAPDRWSKLHERRADVAPPARQLRRRNRTPARPRATSNHVAGIGTVGYSVTSMTPPCHACGAVPRTSCHSSSLSITSRDPGGNGFSNKMDVELAFSSNGNPPRKVALLTLERLIKWRGKPQALGCDNGPEYVSAALINRAEQRRIRLDYIQPGKQRRMLTLSTTTARSTMTGWVSTCLHRLAKYRNLPLAGCGSLTANGRTWPWEASPRNRSWPS